MLSWTQPDHLYHKGAQILLSWTELNHLYQTRTNPRHHVAKLTEFCYTAPNIGGSSAWLVLILTLLEPRISSYLPDFLKICGPYF